MEAVLASFPSVDHARTESTDATQSSRCPPGFQHYLASLLQKYGRQAASADWPERRQPGRIAVSTHTPTDKQWHEGDHSGPGRPVVYRFSRHAGGLGVPGDVGMMCVRPE